MTRRTGGDPVQDETTPETTHDLLLALAGHVDDDLLAWTRELVAVGEDAHAVELLSATLVADRTALPAPVRAGLVDAARSARTDLDAAAALPPAGAAAGTGHRFDAGPADDAVTAALLALPDRQLHGCRVLCSRRLTPAGAAPGPLPHPVVLVEVEPGTRPTDVLAYQLAVALERAGVRASVEVLTMGAAVPAYHAEALRSARPVRSDAPTPTAAPAAPLSGRRRAPDALPPAPQPAAPQPADPQPAATPRADAAGPAPQPAAATPAAVGDPAASQPAAPAPAAPAPAAPAPAAATTPTATARAATADGAARRTGPLAVVGTPAEPSGTTDRDGTGQVTGETAAPHPAPRPTPRPVTAARSRRQGVTPITRSAPPDPIPLVRRTGPTPIVRPLVPVAEPTSGHEDAAPPVATGTDSASTAPRQPPAPAFELLHDPLNGPLNVPLMEPLLDPTIRDGDPPAGSRFPDEPAEDGIEDSWSGEWLSGGWAMSPSALDTPAEEIRGDGAGCELPGGEPGTDEGPAGARTAAIAPVQPAPRPVPRRAARHRSTDNDDHRDAFLDAPRNDEPAAVGPEPVRPAGGAIAFPPAGRPEPEPERDAEPDGLGLRPESLARLTDADRQLLARLQAELLEGRKPRVSRRAGIAGDPGTNGSGTNGSGTNGRAGPPELAD
jgi:hypothetical protein